MAEHGLFRRGLVPTVRPAFVQWSSVTLLRGIAICLLMVSLILAAKTTVADPLLEPITKSDQPKCWIYTHLVKSGGCTVKKIARENPISRFAVFNSQRWTRGDEWGSHFLHHELTQGSTVFAGGYVEALRLGARTTTAGEGIACDFYTNFRHPVSRVVSAYFYCKTRPEDQLCANIIVRASKVDLLTFVKHWSNFAVRQFALNFISADDVMAYARTPEVAALLPEGVTFKMVPPWYLVKLFFERPWDESGRGGISTTTADHKATRQTGQAREEARLYDLLQPVQALVRDGYTAVGLLEEWNTTLALFDKVFNVPGIHWGNDYAKQGDRNVLVANHYTQRAEVLEKAWTDEKLRKHMHLDLLLYDHAVHVFRQHARSHDLL